MELLTRMVTKSTLISLLFAFISTSTSAQDDLGIRLKTTEPMLTASPNICELKPEQRACSTTIALVWEVPRAGNFCLYHEKTQTRLACWENKWSGAYQFSFSSGAAEDIWLIREDSGALLVHTEIKVIGAIEQRVRARRRSGFWRIF